MAFEDRLKEARKAAKLTQEQAALKIGVAKSTWAGYESGNSQPDTLKIAKIMDALKVDANFLWQDYFDIEKAPASRQEPLISMEASNSILDGLIKAGIINDGPDLSDEDLAFLTHIVELLDTWFSRKR